MDNILLFQIVGSITTLISLYVAIKALLYTRKGHEIQEEHNKKSVKPLPYVEPYDYLDYIGVEIQNNGTGPLIIKEIAFENNRNSFTTLIEFFEDKNIIWSTYSENLKDRSILPSSSIMVLELSKEDDANQFNQYREAIRLILRDITVKIVYENIYGEKNNMPDKSLNFFGKDSVKALKKRIKRRKESDIPFKKGVTWNI